MSSITVDVLKLAKGNVYEAHESFIRTFEPQWRQDENIILILCAIVLFTPGRPKTIHSDVLKLEQVRVSVLKVKSERRQKFHVLSEFVLLSAETLFGECLSGMCGQVDIFEIDPKGH